jgi:lipoate-protein ligase B
VLQQAPAREPKKAIFQSLPGLTSYEDARQLQLHLVEERARDLIPDTFLFLEHEPVITRGRGLQRAAGQDKAPGMPTPSKLPPGISFAESERGGDLTYHGPGQLVMYPICKLDGRGFGPDHDVTGFLRKLEGVLLAALSRWGIAGESRADATGVWVGKKKTASIGIAVRKWVSYHGIALNCVNDLEPFHLISPCGYNPDVMTRVTDLNPKLRWTRKTWRSEAEEALREAILEA